MLDYCRLLGIGGVQEVGETEAVLRKDDAKEEIEVEACEKLLSYAVDLS